MAEKPFQTQKSPLPPSETMTALAAEAKRRGLSLAEISRRTGIPKGRLSEYMRGIRRPSIDKAEIIAAAIGVRLVTKPVI